MCAVDPAASRDDLLATHRPSFCPPVDPVSPWPQACAKWPIRPQALPHSLAMTSDIPALLLSRSLPCPASTKYILPYYSASRVSHVFAATPHISFPLLERISSGL